MGILEGKRILVTGVLTDASLAFAVAQLAQAEGAELVLTGAARGLSITRRTARKLDAPADVLELDVTDASQFDAPGRGAPQPVGRGRRRAARHRVRAPRLSGGDVMRAGWDDVAVALQISAYSLKPLTQSLLPLLRAAGGGSVVGLDFDARVAWPVYDWMGVAKAALESLARYLARDVGSAGVRVNLVAAGPARTLAAKSIPGFERFEEVWSERAPLGWDVTDTKAVAQACVAMLSDWFPMTTGEIIHVDGGFHAVGA